MCAPWWSFDRMAVSAVHSELVSVSVYLLGDELCFYITDKCLRTASFL